MGLKGLASIHSEDLAQGQTGMARPSQYHVFNNFNKIRPYREVQNMLQKCALKRFVSGILVVAVLAQPIVGFQPGPSAGYANAAEREPQNSSDQGLGNQPSKVALLLVLAVKEENPVKALALLQAAREELKRENIDSDNANRALAAINAIEVKIRRRLPNQINTSLLIGELPTVVGLNQTGPIAANGSSGTAAPVTTPPLAEKEIQALIAQNPEVREVLWEIGQGRLSRDAENLDGIIKEKTGKSLDEIDQEEALAIAFGNEPGPFYQLLERLNVINLDVSKSNLKLKQEFDGVSIDVLADEIILDATRYAIPAGTLQGVLADYGMSGRFLGISSEVLMTFAINANLALRLSDLYGIEMNNSEKEIILLVVFSIAKVAGQYGTTAAGGGIGDILTKFGQKLGHLKAGGKPGEFVAYLQKILKASAMAKVAGSATAEIMAIQTTPESDADKAKNDAATKHGAKENPAETDPKKIARAKSESLIRNVAAKVNLASLLKASLHGTRSAVETYTLGHVAKYIFKAANESKRAIHNDNFRRFLMTPSGEGFLKLMVLSMNDGRIDLGETTSQQATDLKRKTTFITNIARSGKACSTEDIAALNASKTSGPSPAISSYACNANPNTARFDRLKKEMLTFDEIPNDYISDLRIVPREHRFRMAELIIQMQFLDGDRSPAEVQFFRSTVAKALGVGEAQDLEYFDRIHAFVVDRGGLEPSAKHPAGFKIRGTADPAPYDMGQGYTPPDSPQHPAH